MNLKINIGILASNSSIVLTDGAKFGKIGKKKLYPFQVEIE